MSLSTQILLSLALGVAAGLFFGEWMAPLAVAGDVFVRLLQMTVLPYVVVSLMGGLGRLSYDDARRLGGWFLGLLLVLWLIAFAMVAAMPLSFPSLSSGSFFSTTLVEPAPDVDFVGLYVPTNPFHALANSVVPAVVLFSIAVGIALIGIREKSALLQSLETVGDALLRVSEFVVRLTPIGIFAIAASAAGTMSVDEFGRVQVYLISYIALSLVTTFWVLPGLVAALTPLSAREVLAISKDALVTAFATGSSFVVIPMLELNSKQLLAQGAPAAAEDDAKVASLVDVLIPAAHNFPHTAKVLSLSFILFAGWFSSSPVPISDYPLLFASGVAATFGSVTIAIPFLLDLMQLPHDLFQLFVATGVLNARFGTLLQATHMLALTLLGVCALTGRIRFSLRAIALYATTTLVLVGLTIVGIRVLFEHIVDTHDSQAQVLEHMEPILPTVPLMTHEAGPGDVLPDPQRSRLTQILERGTLRVCHRNESGLPFLYRTEDGRFAGFDLEMAHSLARGLGVGIELVPIEVGYDLARAAPALDRGSCDIFMGLTAVTMDAIPVVAYADPHLELNFGFLVPDHRRREFAELEKVGDGRGLRIAFPDAPYYRDRFQRYLPGATFLAVSGVQEFLKDDGEHYDVMIFPVEIASAWTLLYPKYGVVVPRPYHENLPLAYVLPIAAPEWRQAVDTWIALKRSDGTIDRLYEHWILGKRRGRSAPRWCVIRDVLGWVD